MSPLNLHQGVFFQNFECDLFLPVNDSFVFIKALKEIEGLQYTMTYSQQNCLLECQSNYTLNSCRCVPYYLPKNSLIKYCGKIEKQCVEQAKIDMETVEGNGSSCLCLPSCHFVEYSESKSYAKLSKEVSNDVVISSLSKKYFIRNMAVVQFFFYNSKFTKELKSELYGFTEILSNIGGLLSLCLGFSFLSLVELFYFLTLRVICHVAKSTRNTNRKEKEPPVISFLR